MWIRWRQDVGDADSRFVADIFRGAAEGRGAYRVDFGPWDAIPGSILSKWAWKRFLDSSGSPVNSIPMPTPGSRVRTTADPVRCSSSIQKSTLRVVATVKGMTVST